MACCDDNMPIQYRYSPEGVLERSTNGGANWLDAPQYDPRVYSPQFPPISGEDGSEKRCVAAAGAAALIKEQIGDQLTDDMSRYTLKQLVEDWVGTMLESSNPFQALLTVITNQIFALVITALRAALTDPVYETLQCIFYCAISNDASVNNAQWTQIRADITAQIGGIAGIFLEHLIYLLGTTGTTNLLRSGGVASADCSECDCGEGCSNEWVLRTGFEEFDTIISQSSTQITVQAHTPLSNGVYYVDIHTAEYTLGCYINSINVIAGSVLSTAYTAVPSSDEPVPGLGPVNVCCNRLQPQDAGPFTIQFIFDECPA
jgi:hypothetical protein